MLLILQKEKNDSYLTFLQIFKSAKLMRCGEKDKSFGIMANPRLFQINKLLVMYVFNVIEKCLRVTNFGYSIIGKKRKNVPYKHVKKGISHGHQCFLKKHQQEHLILTMHHPNIVIWNFINQTQS
jgi:hypothetical protein